MRGDLDDAHLNSPAPGLRRRERGTLPGGARPVRLDAPQG